LIFILYYSDEPFYFGGNDGIRGFVFFCLVKKWREWLSASLAGHKPLLVKGFPLFPDILCKDFSHTFIRNFKKCIEFWKTFGKIKSIKKMLYFLTLIVRR